VKRAPGNFTHMSDQYYGWFSRPGGGLFVLEKFKSDSPQLRCLSTELPLGNVLRPDLSYDGRTVLFAHCKYYPGLAAEPDKLTKRTCRKTRFYHLYEINLDGTGLRRLTHGKYDDFDGRYLPDGRIVFLSLAADNTCNAARRARPRCIDGARRTATSGAAATRRGRWPCTRCTRWTRRAATSCRSRRSKCSSGPPASTTKDGSCIPAGTMSIAITLPFMKLWSTLPDGTNAQIVWGNFVRSPHAAFEPRAVPNSHKIVFTASGHHAHAGGPLVLLDPRLGPRWRGALTRLTPGSLLTPKRQAGRRPTSPVPYPLVRGSLPGVLESSAAASGTPRPRGACRTPERSRVVPVRWLRQLEPAVPPSRDRPVRRPPDQVANEGRPACPRRQTGPTAGRPDAVGQRV